MKHWMPLLAGLVVALAACGPGPVGDPSPVGGPGSTVPSAATVPPTVALPSQVEHPDPVDASPEPIAQPIFKPVPDPVPAPAPKPATPIPPTPPPARHQPIVPPDQPVTIGLPPEDDRVAAAIADLVARLGVGPADIEVLDARDVTWRDGSVGCPVPGLAYSQALVPGALIVLRSGDASYRYHSAGDLLPFYCETPQAPLEGSA